MTERPYDNHRKGIGTSSTDDRGSLGTVAVERIEQGSISMVKIAFILAYTTTPGDTSVRLQSCPISIQQVAVALSHPRLPCKMK